MTVDRERYRQLRRAALANVSPAAGDRADAVSVARTAATMRVFAAVIGTVTSLNLTFGLLTYVRHSGPVLVTVSLCLLAVAVGLVGYSAVTFRRLRAYVTQFS